MLFSFESMDSFYLARDIILSLSRYDILKRPVVALIGTRVNSGRKCVTTSEVDEVTRLFPLFYCEIDQEDEAYYILNAVSSHLRVKPEVRAQWSGKTSKRDFLASLRAIPSKLMGSVGVCLEN